MRPIPEYGDLIPLSRFISLCKSGALIGFDGDGEFATADGMPRERNWVFPSTVRREGFKAPEWATHVLWFNR